MVTNKKFSDLPVVTTVQKTDRLAVLDYTGSTPALVTASLDNILGATEVVDKVRSVATTAIPIRLSDEFTNITTGSVWYGRLPFGFTLTSTSLSSRTPSTGGDVTVDILVNGTSIYSTQLTIDAGETTSVTAAAPAVLSTTDIGPDAIVEVLVVAAGTGVAGLKLWLVGKRNDAATSPTPPTTTALTDENFDSASDGVVADQNTTSADSVTGSGSLTHSASGSVEGGTSLHINGTSQHYLTWDQPVTANRYGKFYYQHAGTPSATVYFLSFTAADGATVNFRLGVDTSGHLIIQNGTAGSTDVSNFVLTVGKKYKLAVSCTAPTGTHRVAIFDETVINSESELNATDVLSVSNTSLSFRAENLGLLSTISGGGTIITANLTDEGFNGTNGTHITAANTSADSATGSGSIAFNTGWSVEGTSSMRINGNTNDMLRFDNASHTEHDISLYLRFATAPVGSTQYFYQLKDAANTSTAFQIGITTAGKLRLRNAASGSGTSAIDFTTTLSAGTVYRLDVSATAGSTLASQLYTGANVDSPTLGNATENLTMATSLTATNFGLENIGQISGGSTTSMDISIDRFKTGTNGIPSPIGVTGGSAFECYVDRYQTDSATMPTGINIGGNGTVSELLVPTSGAWWGAATPPSTGLTADPTGLAEWVGAAGRRPDIIHFYKTALNWNGAPTSTERSMLEPNGLPRAIPLYNWKYTGTGGSALTQAQVASGAQDANIINMCNASTGFKSYPYKIMLCLWHEYDNNSSFPTGNTLADYVAAWQHIVSLIRAQGVTNVVFVWCQTGYSSHAGNSSGSNFEAMYPGDSYVDWIAWDPYFQSVNRTDFDLLVNENISGPSGWTGFYNWASAAHPSKPLMLAEWGTWFNAETVAQAAAQITSVGSLIQNYPKFKAIVHYNVQNQNDNRIQMSGRETAAAAFAAVGDLAYFNVGTQNAS